MRHCLDGRREDCVDLTDGPERTDPERRRCHEHLPGGHHHSDDDGRGGGAAGLAGGAQGRGVVNAP